MDTDNPLSERETEIVSMISNGKKTSDIARELNLSEHTVDTHRKNIHRKMNTTATVQMLNEARRRGIIP